MKIASICARPRPGRLFGMEIEVENVRDLPPGILHAEDNHWNLTDDGSLRNNGREFVSPPLSALILRGVAIPKFYNWKKEFGYEANGRTGIHVHANVSDLDADQVRAIAALYAVLEPAVFALAGEGREQNIHCIPWYRAYGEADLLSESLEAQERAGRLQRACKYSALNVRPILTLGTIEFRQALTFDTDRESAEWVLVVASIVNAGINAGLVTNVMRKASDPDALLRDVLGKTASEKALRIMDCTMDAACDKYDTLSVAHRLAPRRVMWKMPNLGVSSEDNSRGYHETVPMPGRGGGRGRGERPPGGAVPRMGREAAQMIIDPEFEIEPEGE